jgi:hypothetical protein
MWYLIIPPIVVVASLLFVLWYLSRKGADPLVAARASRLEEAAGQQVSFSRTKSFFLRLLEKMAYRFKVASLKAHNKLHGVTQSLKESQRRFTSKSFPEEMPHPSDEETNARREAVYTPQTDNVRHFFDRRATEAKEQNVSEESEKESIAFFPAKKEEVEISGSAIPVTRTETTLEAPIVRTRREVAPIAQVRPSEKPLVSSPSRPMVSERATHPERVHKKVATRNGREEDFIARIAANPKDFTAYEGLGDYYLEANNVKDAKECYRQVLKLSPVQRMVKIKIRRLEKILSQKAA